jgi:class 3 adenylate cyclase
MANPVRWVLVGDKNIAYRAVGAGVQDLCIVLPTVGTIEVLAEPPARRLIEGMAEHFRVISFDRRGSGLSDPLEEPPTLEEQMEDVVAVLDACASGQTVISSEAEGSMMAALFAAAHPERVSHLVLTHPMARVVSAPGYDWAWPDAETRNREFTGRLLARWGTGENAMFASPVMAARDPDFNRWWGRWERLSCAPGTLENRMSLVAEMDVREVLPQVQAPTLIIDRPDAPAMNSKHAEYFAEHIPNARLARLPGRDSISFGDGMEAWMETVLEFCGTTASSARRSERTLATVLFTDIVGSTSHAAEVGDRRWRETLEQHDRLTRDLVGRYGGTAIKSTGDGFLATFDGPARAVRCAAQLTERVDDLGIQLRAGLHAGEVELIGADVGGMAVHIGARIGALGGPGEVLTSSTVRDLVVGSGIEFADRGEEELKGVPGAWRIFSVSDAGD